jgi:hypothetical protein
MLADLAQIGAQADTIFPPQFSTKHGGKRREGPASATELVEQLIKIYKAMRARYPESGSVFAFGASLKQFVRAGLAFAASPQREVIASDGKRYRPSEARFFEDDLRKTLSITDDAIRGVFDRLHGSSRK